MGFAGLLFDQHGNEPCPARLMCSTDPGSAVTVEVLEEQDVIVPVVARVEAIHAGVDWALPVLAFLEDGDQSIGEVVRDLIEVFGRAALCRH